LTTLFFVDGNERTALAAPRWSEDDLSALALGVAEGEITKPEVAVFLQRHGEACDQSPAV
jgi:hypothetical protein